MSCCVASPQELQAQLADAQRALSDVRKALSASKKALADAERYQRDQAEAYASLRRCVDGANAPIVAVDRYGLITRWNKKAEEVFRCPSESALRRPFSDFLEHGSQLGLADLQAAIAAKASASGSAQLQRRFCVRQRAAGQPWYEVLFSASSCPSISSRDSSGVLYIGQEVEPLFQMARKVIEDHDRWISAAQDEEVNRKERQELLRVAAEIPQDTQVTMHFQLPTGSKVTEKMQPTQTSYEIYTKAFQLLQQEREFRIKVEGAEGEHFSKDVNEANFHLSLESLGLKPGCSYTVIVS